MFFEKLYFTYSISLYSERGIILKSNWNEDVLNELLRTPSDGLIDDLAALDGDIMVLGAGGKMGPDLCILAARALKKIGKGHRVFAVSRFSDKNVADELASEGVEILPVDLLEPGTLENLPDCENIVFMAGKKFGTNGNEFATWAMNSGLPTLVTRRFPKSRFTVFSSGNLYPKVSTASGGATEDTPLLPIGDYVMSCLGRERAFEYAAHTYGTRVSIMRLNYAVDLRYGVIHDIAQTILSDRPVDLSAMPSFNCIWQKSANEAALRLLLSASTDVNVLNVTGPESAGVRSTAERLSKLLGKSVTFIGEEAPTAYLNDASKMFALYGYPEVPLATLIEWQAEWLLGGGRSLGKPTHFEERNGKY